MTISRIALSRVSSLARSENTDFPPTNNPPAWDTQPSVSFSTGTPGTYDFNPLVSDADGDDITFSFNTGAVSLPTGVSVGVCAQGDGTNYLDGGDIAAFDFAGSFSYEFVVKNPGNAGEKGLVTKKDGNDAGWGSWVSGTSLIVRVEDDLGNLVAETVTSAIPADAQRYRVSVTIDRTADEMRIYINGALDAGSPVDISSVTGTLANAATFRVFADSAAAAFDGQIDDVRIWNDVRTAAEILDNYDIELTGTEGGFIGYWTMAGAEGSITTVTDDSTSSNTLTDTGAGDIVRINSGTLHYDGDAGLTNTTGHVCTISDGTDTTDSNSFGISGNLGYPLISTYRIADQNFAETDLKSDQQRQHIANTDCVVLGLFSGGPMDGPDAGYLSRTQIIEDLKDKNPDLQIFWYWNAMETSDNGSESANKINAETGPPGAETHWGVGNSDWWNRNATGTQVPTPFGLGINITDYVTADSNGDYWGQWYAKNIIKNNYLAPWAAAGIEIGPGGAGVYLDNFFTSARQSASDWDGDGVNEDQDYYDPENPAHLAADAGGVAAAGRWRWGYQSVVDQLRTDYPNIQVIANLTLWSRRYSGSLPNPNKVLPEYQSGGEFSADIQGGIAEGLVWNEAPPWSGVLPDGTTALTSGSWQEAYNAYEYVSRVSADPNFAQLDMWIHCAQRDGFTADGRRVYLGTPDSGSAFNLMRWGLCSTLLHNGYFNGTSLVVGATREGFFKSTVLFDEYGSINQGTTGLVRHYLGQPIEDPPTAPFKGNMWKRRYQFGVAVVNTNNDDTDPSESATSEEIWAGQDLYYITGVQDPVANPGGLVGTLVLPPIDGRILLTYDPTA